MADPMSAPEGGDRYVAASVAAHLTGVPVRTLRRWAASGQVAAIGGHRGRLYDLEAVQILANMRPEGGQEAATTRPETATPRPAANGRPQGGHETAILEDEAGHLAAIVREQQQTILELSGRVGWLQAQLQARDDQIKLLTAGPEPDLTANLREGAPAPRIRRPGWQFWPWKRRQAPTGG